MAINPYTLQGLYNKGILDYVPTDLVDGAQVSALNGMTNPYAGGISADQYMKSAMQGNLYQAHGNMSDSFTRSTGVLPGYEAYAQSQGIGSKSTVGTASFFGSNDIGSNSQIGINSIYGNGQGIGVNSPMGISNQFGGIPDVGGEIANGTAKAYNIASKVPNIAWGILGLGAMCFALKKVFTRKKPKEGFFKRAKNWINEHNPFSNKKKVEKKEVAKSWKERLKFWKNK